MSDDWRRTKIQAGLAGVTREGGLDRLVRPTPRAVPHGLRLAETSHGPAIQWDAEWLADAPPIVAEHEGILEAFCGLSGSADGDYLRFAQRFGVLDLCIHGLPRTHAGIGGCDPLPAEPISAWTCYSGQARAALTVGVKLHRGESPTEDDLRALNRDVYGDGWPREELGGARRVGTLYYVPAQDEVSVESGRWHLSRLVGHWLELANIRPLFDWPFDRASPNVELRGAGAFAVIVRDLVFSLARVDGLVFCDGCGAAYTPARRPSPGRRNFCVRCRKNKVPLRLAKQDERARKRRVGPG